MRPPFREGSPPDIDTVPTGPALGPRVPPHGREGVYAYARQWFDKALALQADQGNLYAEQKMAGKAKMDCVDKAYLLRGGFTADSCLFFFFFAFDSWYMGCITSATMFVTAGRRQTHCGRSLFSRMAR